MSEVQSSHVHYSRKSELRVAQPERAFDDADGGRTMVSTSRSVCDVFNGAQFFWNDLHSVLERQQPQPFTKANSRCFRGSRSATNEGHTGDRTRERNMAR